MSKSSQEKSKSAIIDYWKLFQDLPSSYVLLEAKPPYIITEVNKMREKLVGVSRKDSVGKPLFEVFPDVTKGEKVTDSSQLQEYFQEVVQTGKPKRLALFRFDLQGEGDAQPRTHYWRSTYIPLRLGSSEVTHILAATQDVTEEYRSEQRVTDIQDRLEAALSIGKVGSWVWHVDDDVIVGDKNLAKLFGMTAREAAQGLKIHRFIEAIHEDDRQRIERAVRQSIRKRSEFDEEYRTRTGKGQLRWVLARGKVEEQDGKLIFPGVIVDITERRDLQAQVELARKQDQLNRQAAKILQERNDELEAIGRTKDEFVALASHQLRTPATAVKQYLGMVLQGYVGTITSMQTEMLEKAFESNERQIQIINQILNAARVDTGRLIMTPVELDLRTLVQGAATDMQSSFEQHRHSFKLTLPEESVPILADSGYLRMAIENMIHNAIIYTPEGGKVRVELTHVGTEGCLKIIDNGVGIKKVDINKLFVKFSRIHNPLSVQAGGSGIGLYLTAEIIRLHGGTVAVTSKIGKGTTFAISLPLVHTKTVKP